MKKIIDFNFVLADINRHMKRIGWDKDKGREYLLEKYGKRSRLLLNDQQILEFRAYLANYQIDKQPTVSHAREKKLKLRSLKLNK